MTAINNKNTKKKITSTGYGIRKNKNNKDERNSIERKKEQKRKEKFTALIVSPSIIQDTIDDLG